MCGIAIYLNCNFKCLKSLIALRQHLNNSIQSRGPDAADEITIQDCVTLRSSVLHIQGSVSTPQPHVDSVSGNILLWNGEVFSGLSTHSFGISDTLSVANLLNDCTTGESNSNVVGHKIVNAMTGIEGPYAFVYYHKDSNTLFFARDPFGRRSLVVLTSDIGKILAICSVTAPTSVDVIDGTAQCMWAELSVDGLFSVCLDAGSSHEPLHCCALWPQKRVRLRRLSVGSNQTLNEQHVPSHHKFLSLLTAAITNRVASLSALFQKQTGGEASENCVSWVDAPSRVGVLFSGGIDSVLLAAVLHLCLPATEAIDLINVSFAEQPPSMSFAQSRSPDRLAAICAMVELQELFPTRKWRLVHVDVTEEERQRHEERIRLLIAPSDTHMDLNIGTAFWFAARGQGYIRKYSRTDKDRLCLGPDCSAVPLLRHGALEGLMPQRSSAKTELSEPTCSRAGCKRVYKAGCLRNFCKKCCDAETKAAVDATLSNVVVDEPAVCRVHRATPKQLMKMQLNLERQRSRIKGKVDELANHAPHSDLRSHGDSETNIPSEVTGVELDPEALITSAYHCSCRVLLVGIGADEQMAGYGRHRTVFQQRGEDALAQELDMDLSRLWKRNLGRDDRCIADHGREAWFPFLDEGVVEFLQQLPLSEIASLDLPAGVGDKKILRDAAKTLGLGQCTELVKRAIQFGTGVAKSTNSIYHSSNRKGSGTTKL